MQHRYLAVIVLALLALTMFASAPRLAAAQTPDDLRRIDLGQVQFAVPRGWVDHGTSLSLDGPSKVADHRSDDGAQSSRIFVDSADDGVSALDYLRSDFEGDLYNDGRQWLQTPESVDVVNADEAALAVEQHVAADGTVRDLTVLVAMQDGFVFELILSNTDDFANSHTPLMVAMVDAFQLVQ
jgi:hypothetical protein